MKQLRSFLTIFLFILFLNFFTPGYIFAEDCCPSGQTCRNGECYIDISSGLPICRNSACDPISGTNPVNMQIPNYISIAQSNFAFNFDIISGGLQSIGAIVSALLPYIYAIAGLLLLGYLLYGGFRLATSFGSPQAIQEAWLIIYHALIGFLILFAAFWIVRIIELTFNICILGNC